MSLQQQLAESQTHYGTSGFLTFAISPQANVLGNQALQFPHVFAAELRAISKTENPSVLPIKVAESAEMRWLVQNTRELSRYQGEWLLIHGSQLLVHSRDIATIRTVVRENDIASPFVYYVPTDSEANSVSI